MTGSAEGGVVPSVPLRGNPYVGPRPFEPGERLYGRDREIRNIDNLLSAERILLLHSPSGAGKSSLIQAGLLPRLKQYFDVWGIARVNQEPVTGAANRYALSVMAGLEEGVPERLRRPPEVFAGLTLREYVDGRPHRRSAPRDVLLIIDQFEEVLTVEPLAVTAKREFFDQLGELLHNPRVFALFALREDYLAPLSPYARQVPTHLHNRFRVNLLDLDGAREAIVNPALAGGREFPAAGRLVRDLAKMRVQQSDGSFREQIGHHVEPVELQVVCFRLWNAMPAAKQSIEAEDLERFGDVSEALGDYYADSVSRLAAGNEFRERAIRGWFGEALITAEGIRGQVLRGVGNSEGLDNDVILQLLDTHLVRAEQHSGVTWYELAHDRLIEPVKDDNAAWRAEHLSEFQQQAMLWERQGRPPKLLLKDEELLSAERWSVGSVLITEVEVRFLEESGKAQAITDRERRQARRIKVLGIAAMVIGALAIVASVFAVRQMFEANRQRQLAEEQRQEADRQREDAVVQRQEAERQREEADHQREQAVTQRQEADHHREQAVVQRQEAERQRRRAEEESKAADVARREAEALRAIAEQKKQVAENREKQAEAGRLQAEEQQHLADRGRLQAEEQQQIALGQREDTDRKLREARRLRLVAVAEALAARAQAMREKEHRELAGLLALQAYRLSQRDGEAENTRIHDAMRLAHERLTRSRIAALFSRLSTERGPATTPAQLAEEICRKVTRNLTPMEWQRHVPVDFEYESTCPGLPAVGGGP